MTLQRFIHRLATVGALGATGLGLSACEDLLTESPPHVLVPDNLFASAAGFDAGLNALYDQVRQEFTGFSGNNEHRIFLMQIGVDNAFGGYSNDPISLIANGWGVRNNPSSDQFYKAWVWLYETINGANTIIERAENPAVKWTGNEKNRVVAEARLIRAWAYRHLSYLFGDVPLALTESKTVKTDWDRAPVAEVLKQIEADLLFAEQHLPTSFRDGKLNKFVAQHYLAEHYLRTGENAKAEAKAQAVVSSGQFKLITARYGVEASKPGVAFMDQFKDGNALRAQGNTEVLWSLEFEQNAAGGGRHAMRRAWVPQYFRIPGIPLHVEHGGRGQQRANPTNFAWKLYEPQDERFSGHAVRKFYMYLEAKMLPKGKTLGDTLWLTPRPEKVEDVYRMSTRKWDWSDPGNITQGYGWGDIAYLRLADTYLLLAEAQFKQGKLAQAAQNLNVVRQRAKATPVAPAELTLDFILDERSRELLAEEHRRYTLLRTGKWMERTRKHNPIGGPNITDRDTLFPIPEAVIDANLDKEMKQNPGY